MTENSMAANATESCVILSYRSVFNDVYETTEQVAGVFDAVEQVKEILSRAEPDLEWVQQSDVWETAVTNGGGDRWELWTCQRNRFYDPNGNYGNLTS